MKAIQLFNIANEYFQSGNAQMAIQLWQDCTKTDELFAPAYINLFNLAKQNNQEDQCLQLFDKLCNCPLTWNTSKVMPQIEGYIAEIQKKRQPQPQEKK